MNNNEIMGILTLVSNSNRNKKMVYVFGAVALLSAVSLIYLHQKNKKMKTSVYFLDGKLKYYTSLCFTYNDKKL